MYKSVRFCSLARRSILDKREIHTTKKVPANILQIHRKHSKNKFYKRWILVCKAEDGDSGYKTVILPCPKNKSRGALPDLEDQIPVKAAPKFPDFGSHPTRTYPPKLPKEPEPEEEKDCTNFPGEPVLKDKPKKKDKQKKKKKAEQKFKILPCPNYVKSKGALPSSFEEQGFRLCHFPFASPDPPDSKGATTKPKAEPKKIVLEIVEKRPPAKTKSVTAKPVAAEGPPQLELVQTANNYNALDEKAQVEVKLKLPEKQVSTPSAKSKTFFELVDKRQDVTVKKPPKLSVFKISKSIYIEGSKLLKKKLESKKVAKPPQAVSERDAAAFDRRRIQIIPPKLSVYDVSKLVSKTPKLSKESVQKQKLETVAKATKTVTNDKEIVSVRTKRTARVKSQKLTVSGVSKSIGKVLSKVSLRQQIPETVLKQSKATADVKKIEPTPKPVEAIAKEKRDETKPTELSSLDVSKSETEPLTKGFLQNHRIETVVKPSKRATDNKGIETTAKPVETTTDKKSFKVNPPKLSVFDVSKSVSKAISKVTLRRPEKEIVPESSETATDDKKVAAGSKSPERVVDVADKKTTETVTAKPAVFDVSKSVTEPQLKESLPKQQIEIEIESKPPQTIADDKETEVASKSTKPIEAETDQERGKITPLKLFVFDISKVISKPISQVTLRKQKKEIVPEPSKASADDKEVGVASKANEPVVDVADKKTTETVTAKPAVFDVSKSVTEPQLKESLPKQQIEIEIESKPPQTIADDKETEVASKSTKPIEAETDQERGKITPLKLFVFDISKVISKPISQVTLRKQKKEIVPEPSKASADDKEVGVASKANEPVVDVADKKNTETVTVKPAVFDVSKSVTEPQLKESPPKQEIEIEIESKPPQSVADDKETEVASKSTKLIEAVTDQESDKVKAPKLSVFDVSKSVSKAISKVTLRKPEKEIVPESSETPTDDREVGIASKSPKPIVDVADNKTTETVNVKPAVFDVSKSVTEPHLKESPPKQEIEIEIESKPSQSIAEDKKTEVASKSTKPIEAVTDQESGTVKPPKLSVFDVSKSVTEPQLTESLPKQEIEIETESEPSQTIAEDKETEVASKSTKPIEAETDQERGRVTPLKLSGIDVSKAVTKAISKVTLQKPEKEIVPESSETATDDKEVAVASKSPEPVVDVADKKTTETVTAKPAVFDVSKSLTEPQLKESLPKQEIEIEIESKPSQTIADDKETEVASKSTKPVVDVADMKTTETVTAKPAVFDVSKSVIEPQLKESLPKQEIEIEIELKPPQSIADDKETEVAAKSTKPIEAVTDQESGKKRAPKLSVFDFSKSVSKAISKVTLRKPEKEIVPESSETTTDDNEVAVASKSPERFVDVTDNKTTEAVTAKPAVFDVSKSVTKPHLKESLPRQEIVIEIELKAPPTIADDNETEVASKSTKPIEAVIDQKSGSGSGRVKAPKLSVFDVSKSFTKTLSKVSFRKKKREIVSDSSKTVKGDEKIEVVSKSPNPAVDVTDKRSGKTTSSNPTVFDFSKSFTKSHLEKTLEKQKIEIESTPSQTIADDKKTEVASKSTKPVEAVTDLKTGKVDPLKLAVFKVSKSISKTFSKESQQPVTLKIVPKPAKDNTDDKEMASKPPKPVVINRASTETKPPKLFVFDISKSVTKAIFKVAAQQPEPKDSYIPPKPVPISHEQRTMKSLKDDKGDTGTPQVAAETKPQKLSVFDISKSIMKPRFKISVQQQEPKRVPKPSEVSNVHHKEMEDTSEPSKVTEEISIKPAVSNIPKTSVNKYPRLTVFKNRKRSSKIKTLSHKESQKPSIVELPKQKSDVGESKIHKEDEIYKFPRGKRPKEISEEKLKSTAKMISVEHEGKKHDTVEFAKCATCHIKPSDVSVSDISTNLQKGKLVYFKKYPEKLQKTGDTKSDDKAKHISKSVPKMESNLEPAAKFIKVKPLVYDPKKRFGRDVEAEGASNDKPNPIPVNIKENKDHDEYKYKSAVTPKFLIIIKSKPISYIKHKHEDDGKLASATTIKPDPKASEYAAVPVTNVTPPHTVHISTTSASDGTPEFVKHVVNLKKVPEDDATLPSESNKEPKPVANIPSQKEINKKDDASTPVEKFKVKPVAGGGKRKPQTIEFTEECDPPCPPKEASYKATIAQSDGLEDNKPVPKLLVNKHSKKVKSRRLRKLRNIFNTDAALKWFGLRKKRRSGGGGKSGDGTSSGKPSGGGSDSGPASGGSSGPSESGAAPTMPPGPPGLPGPPAPRNIPNPISASTVFSVRIPTPNCLENSKKSETLKQKLKDPMKNDETEFFIFKPIYASVINKIGHSKLIADSIVNPDLIGTSEGSIIEYKEIIKPNSLNYIASTVPEMANINQEAVIHRDTIETKDVVDVPQYIACKIETDSKERNDDNVLYSCSGSNYSVGRRLSKGNGKFKSQIKPATFGKQISSKDGDSSKHPNIVTGTTGPSCAKNANTVPPCDNVFKDVGKDEKDKKVEIAVPPCDSVFVVEDQDKKDQGKCALAATAVGQCSAAPCETAPCAADQGGASLGAGTPSSNAPAAVAATAATPSATATNMAPTTAAAVVVTASLTSPINKAKNVSDAIPEISQPAGTSGIPPPSTAVSTICRAASNLVKIAYAPNKMRAASANTKAVPPEAKAPPPAKVTTPQTIEKVATPKTASAKLAKPPVKAATPVVILAPPAKAPAVPDVPLTAKKVTAIAKAAPSTVKEAPPTVKATSAPDKGSSPTIPTPTAATPSSSSTRPTLLAVQQPVPCAAPPAAKPPSTLTPAPASGRCPVHCQSSPAEKPPAPSAAKPPEPCKLCTRPPPAKISELCKPSSSPPGSKPPCSLPQAAKASELCKPSSPLPASVPASGKLLEPCKPSTSPPSLTPASSHRPVHCPLLSAENPPVPCSPSLPPPAPTPASGRCPVDSSPLPAENPPAPPPDTGEKYWGSNKLIVTNITTTSPRCNASPQPPLPPCSLPRAAKPPEPCNPSPTPPPPATSDNACKLLQSAPPPPADKGCNVKKEKPPGSSKPEPEASVCVPEPCQTSEGDNGYKVPPCEKPFNI